MAKIKFGKKDREAIFGKFRWGETKEKNFNTRNYEVKTDSRKNTYRSK